MKLHDSEERLGPAKTWGRTGDAPGRATRYSRATGHTRGSPCPTDWWPQHAAGNGPCRCQLSQAASWEGDSSALGPPPA